MSETDRFVGVVTAFILSIGGAVLLVRRLKRLQLQNSPDAYHRSRYVKHRLVVHRGSCCCQKVQFALEAPVTIEALDCESKIRYPHMCISPDSLNVYNGQQHLGVFSTDANAMKTISFFCTCCGRLENKILRSQAEC